MAAAGAIGIAFAGAGAAPQAAIADDAWADYASWAVNPAAPGSDLPPSGRSLFDYLVSVRSAGGAQYQVPFPFSALLDRIRARLGQHEYGGGTRIVLIPMGRSLQRIAAAPDFFRYPRLVFAVTGEPAADDHHAGVLLKDRLYIGYVEKTAMLEVISYNETAGRFEFQLVKDYRDGARPKVFYANRTICISCHQNHAPVFSQPIWGETNANNRAADMLAPLRARYQLSEQANVDFPDDIEKSTLRANALVTLQHVWRQGCADAQDALRSRRCRAAAFTAVLQYGLSGKRDFDSVSPSFLGDFVATVTRSWQKDWPLGLHVAQSSLPDRNPFGGAGAYYGGGSAEEAVDLIAASNVAANLDPLNPRPAREIWRFSGAMDANRLVSGWASFFAPDDFRALDSLLSQHSSRRNLHPEVYRAQCAATRDVPGAETFRLHCAGSAENRDVNLDGRFDDAGNGRIDWVNLGPVGHARTIVVKSADMQRIGAENVLHGVPKNNAMSVRLPDGRTLAGIEIRLPDSTPGREQPASVRVQVEIVVVDDFSLARQAIDRMLAEKPALFDDTPLVRSLLMPALLSQLGAKEHPWCCADDRGLPPAALDLPEVNASALEVREWRPLFQYCAGCHLTHERFPPNFLSGDAMQVSENLRQCAPRMLVRLSAWHAAAESRIKSPMPPPMALRAFGMTARRWADSEELESLRAYVEGLIRQQDRSLDVDALLKSGYEALPACLPAVRSTANAATGSSR